VGQMNTTTQYNPEIHHRRSIRLKGHDYAGGGVYFVTICAHRDAGEIFADPVAKEVVSRVWQDMPNSAVGAGLVPALSLSPEKGTHEGCLRKGTHEGCLRKGTHEGCPYVVMPDHFHALVQMRRSDVALGDIVGAFKSLVVHEYIAGVKAGRLPRFSGKIWHRNYYEAIVRSPEAAEKIAEYIRMNPWRCVTDFGDGLRGIGNPALWNQPKVGVLCSRNAPRPESIPTATAYLGGFHSPMEKEIFVRLQELKKPVIWCPAWGLERAAFAPGVREALEQNRMLMLEMRNRDGNLAAAEQRNAFVIDTAENLWLPHVTPGGMLDRLMTTYNARDKTIRNNAS
jgi:putative transposase